MANRLGTIATHVGKEKSKIVSPALIHGDECTMTSHPTRHAKPDLESGGRRQHSVKIATRPYSACPQVVCHVPVTGQFCRSFDVGMRMDGCTVGVECHYPTSDVVGK